MQLPDYISGTVSIENGSTSLTGSGTAWKTADLKEGDIFYKAGYSVLIASVDSDTGITLADAWPGTGLEGAAYAIRYAPDNGRVQGQTRQLLDLWRQGIYVTPDAVGTLAGRDDYDDQPEGFKYLADDSDPWVLYAKLSNTSADWSTGTSWIGEKGDDGDSGPAGADGDITWEGAWATSTAYTTNQAVSNGGSSYVCITNHTSGTFATDLAAGKWELMAQKGDTGATGATGAGADIAADTHAATSKTTPVDADELPLVDSAASNVLKKLTWANVKATLKAYTDTLYLSTTLAHREVLTANRTYYVRSDGSDSNDGQSNTSGGAFLTYAKAMAVLAAIDLGGFTATVQVQDGTWTTAVNLPKIVGGGAILQGNTVTPANCAIALASGAVINADGVSGWTIQGFKVSTGSLWGIWARNASAIALGKMEFGACPNGHVYSASNSVVNFTANYSITGAGANHWQAYDGAIIICQALTVTLSGSLTFSSAFAVAGRTGIMAVNANTFSGGTITGTRYICNGNSVIDTAGGGTSYLPGSANGSPTTGGQYL